MSYSPPKNNTDFALIPMDDVALALSPVQRQLTAAANLYAYEDGGARHTTLTPRKLADLTGCSLRTAQRQTESHLGTVDLTLPRGRFVKLAGDNPIWQLSPRDWACAVAIQFLMESARSSATSHTTETIARYAGISTHAVKLALKSLRAAGHIATETRFDHAAGKRRRTVKNGLAPATRQNRANSNSNPAQNDNATKSRLSTRQNRADTHDKIAPMVRQNRANGISSFMSLQHESAAGAVAAAGGLDKSPPTQNQNPELEVDDVVMVALSRFTETQRRDIIALIYELAPAAPNKWLLAHLPGDGVTKPVPWARKALSDWATEGPDVLRAIADLTYFAQPETPAQPKRRYSADGKRVWIEGRGWLDASPAYPNQPAGGFAAETARRQQLNDDATPTTSGYVPRRPVDTKPAPIYNETPERKAALSGTDTDTSTHGNAETFTVEDVTGTPGTEAAQPVPAPDHRPTPDAVVDTRPSVSTPQRSRPAATERTVADIDAQIAALKSGATTRRPATTTTGAGLSGEQRAKLLAADNAIAAKKRA
jgi:hypothetical protein